MIQLSLRKVRMKRISSESSFRINRKTKTNKVYRGSRGSRLFSDLGFLKGNLWPRIHVSGVCFYTKLPLDCKSWVPKWRMVRANNRTVSLSEVSHPHWPQSSFEEWARMGHSDLLEFGICLFLILLCAFHCPPRNNQVSHPLLPRQLLVWYLLNHCFFWHVSGFSWKVQSRVFCILQGHIHLERRKEDCVCMRVRIILTSVHVHLWLTHYLLRKRLIDFVLVIQSPRHPVSRVCNQNPMHSSSHVCQDISLLRPHKMCIRWQSTCSRVTSLDSAANLPGCCPKGWEKHGGGPEPQFWYQNFYNWVMSDAIVVSWGQIEKGGQALHFLVRCLNLSWVQWDCHCRLSI